MATCPAQAVERVEFSRPADLHGVEMLLADNCARRWRAFHETYSICTVLSGTDSRWTYRRKTYQSTSADELQLMEPGEVHANTRITSVASFRVLFIDPALMSDAAKALGMACSMPHFRFMTVDDEMRELVRSFRQLHASTESEESPLERQSRFAACVRMLLERCAEEALPRQPSHTGHVGVARTREFVLAHCRDRISLADLETVSGLSRYHLVRAFATAYGLPPHAFQTHVRVAQAQRMLAAGASPSRAAADLGFADQSHFTRHFRRILGVAPGEFIRAVR